MTKASPAKIWNKSLETRTCLDCCSTFSTSSFVTSYSVLPARCGAQEPLRASFCCRQTICIFCRSYFISFIIAGIQLRPCFTLRHWRFWTAIHLGSVCICLSCPHSLHPSIIIMYIYHALINAVSAHMIHINLNMIFYTHVEHSPAKTIYIKYYI